LGPLGAEGKGQGGGNAESSRGGGGSWLADKCLQKWKTVATSKGPWEGTRLGQT